MEEDKKPINPELVEFSEGLNAFTQGKHDFENPYMIDRERAKYINWANGFKWAQNNLFPG